MPGRNSGPFNPFSRYLSGYADSEPWQESESVQPEEGISAIASDVLATLGRGPETLDELGRSVGASPLLIARTILKLADLGLIEESKARDSGYMLRLREK